MASKGLKISDAKPIQNQQDLLEYWQQKCGTKNIPSRQDIDPLDFPKLWPQIVMYKLISQAPLDFMITRMGVFLVEKWNYDQTGKLFSQAFAGPYQNEAREIYQRVVDTGIPSIDTMDAGWMGKDYISYTRMTLPLSDDGQNVNRLMLYISFEPDMTKLRHQPPAG